MKGPKGIGWLFGILNIWPIDFLVFDQLGHYNNTYKDFTYNNFTYSINKMLH